MKKDVLSFLIIKKVSTLFDAKIQLRNKSLVTSIQRKFSSEKDINKQVCTKVCDLQQKLAAILHEVKTGI